MPRTHAPEGPVYVTLPATRNEDSMLILKLYHIEAIRIHNIFDTQDYHV